MAEPIDPEKTRQFGTHVDFGHTAHQYARDRAGFPDRLFVELVQRGLIKPGLRALDIGTGTGTIARNLALRGLSVEAMDPAPEMMTAARELDRQAGVNVSYREGSAEALPFKDNAFDIVTAGQCWHWFDRSKAAGECSRALAPGGVLVIAHFDWLPVSDNLVAATEALIQRYNPAWTMGGGTGFYPAWPADMTGAGFTGIESFSFDVDVLYSHAAWRGRIQASAGVRASLTSENANRFDSDLAALMARSFPEDPQPVPHRCWAVFARKLD